MHGVMYLFATLAFIGGGVIGLELISDPLTRWAGVAALASALVSGMLLIAIGRILDDLHQLKARLGLTEPPEQP